MKSRLRYGTVTLGLSLSFLYFDNINNTTTSTCFALLLGIYFAFLYHTGNGAILKLPGLRANLLGQYTSSAIIEAIPAFGFVGFWILAQKKSPSNGNQWQQ